MAYKGCFSKNFLNRNPAQLRPNLKKIHYIYYMDVLLRSRVGEFKSFGNYKGLGIMFPKILDAILTYYERGTFSDSSLHLIFEFENFRFPFLYEKYPNFESKM